MSTTDNKKIVNTFIDSVFAGINPELAIDLLADECTWWMPGNLPTSGLFEGKQTIVSSVLAADGGVIKEGSKFTEERTMICEGDRVSSEWAGGFQTVTGFDYKNRYHVAFELKDGKIIAIREYNDTQYLKEAFFS